MKVSFVYDPIYLKHDTRLHVENAKRLEAIVSHLEESGLKQQLTAIEPRPDTPAPPSIGRGGALSPPIPSPL